MMGSSGKKRKPFAPLKLQVRRQVRLQAVAVAASIGVLTLQGAGWAAENQTVPVSAKAIQTGYELLEKGWVDAAIEAFGSAVQQSPNSVDASLGLAIAYQRNGKTQDAWQQYQQVLQLQPNQPKALQAIGTMASYRPEWQRQGITALTRLLAQQPSDWAARRQRALLHFYQGQLDESLADYEQVLAEENSKQQLTGEDLLGAAQVLTYRDRPTSALRLFERYQQQSGPIPDAPAPAYAQALYTTGRAEQAIQVLSQLLKAAQANPDGGINPRQEQLQLALVQAHLANQQPDIALGIYDRLVQQFPQKLSLRVRQLALAQELKQLCSDDVAAELRSHFTQIPNPSQQQQQQALAQALVPLEPQAEFLDLYQELMQAQVDAPFLHFRIAQMQAERGEFDAAQRSLKLYAASNPEDADFTAELFQAELYRRQGAFELSQGIYQTVLNQDAQNIAAQAGLGGLALQQQDFLQAQQRFNQVLAIDPEHVTARASLAEVKAAQGKPITALRELEQLAQGPCSQAEHCDLKRRSQQIRQRLQRQRGFQPFWERY